MKHAHLTRKLIVTIGLLLLVRFGCFVPLPGVNRAAFDEMFAQHPTLQFFNLLYGGGLRHASVLALGVLPFTLAEALWQLAEAVVPVLASLRRGDSAKKQRLAHFRAIGVPALTALSAALIARPLLHSAYMLRILDVNAATILMNVGLLSVGATLLMLAIRLMARFGIGLGSEGIMVMGILGEYAYQARLMAAASGVAKMWWPALLLLGVAVIYVVVAFAFQHGERRIPVQYARRVFGRRTIGGRTESLRIRVLETCVAPICNGLETFVLLALAVAAYHRQGLCNPDGPGSLLLKPVVVYPLLTVYLLVWPYYSRAIIWDPAGMAESLKTYGGYIPGIRPGERTARHLDAVLTRITISGSLALIGLLTFPVVAGTLTGWPIGLAGLAFFRVANLMFEIAAHLNALRGIKPESRTRQQPADASAQTDAKPGQAQAGPQTRAEESAASAAGIDNVALITARLNHYQAMLAQADAGGFAADFLPPLDEQIRAIDSLHTAFRQLAAAVTNAYGETVCWALKLDEWARAPFDGQLDYNPGTIRSEGAYATVEATHTSSAGHVKKLLLILVKQGEAWYFGQIPVDPRYGIAEKFVGGHYFGRVPVPGNSAPYDAFCGRVKSIVRFLYQYQDALKTLARKTQTGQLSEQMFTPLFQRGQERFLRAMRDLYTPNPANTDDPQKSP